MGAPTRIRPWDGNLTRESLSLPLRASIGRITGPELSRFYELGETAASVSARASLTGQALRRVAFPGQPEVLPVPKPRLLGGPSKSAAVL